jgi:hypothetical protein
LDDANHAVSTSYAISGDCSKIPKFYQRGASSSEPEYVRTHFDMMLLLTRDASLYPNRAFDDKNINWVFLAAG